MKDSIRYHTITKLIGEKVVEHLAKQVDHIGYDENDETEVELTLQLTRADVEYIQQQSRRKAHG